MSDETAHALREAMRTRALLCARDARMLAVGMHTEPASGDRSALLTKLADRFDLHAEVIVSLLCELRRLAP